MQGVVHWAENVLKAGDCKLTEVFSNKGVRAAFAEQVKAAKTFRLKQ